MEANQNILLIRLKSIGDILFTLPAVHQLRETFPEGKISFLVSKEYAPLLAGFRDVDAVIALDRARFRRPNPGVIIAQTFSLLRHLRRPKFALAIDLQGYGETALLTWWTGAPQRWGTVYRAARKWAYTRGVSRNPGCHPVECFLSLLQTGGLPPARIRNQFTLPGSAAGKRAAFSRHVDWTRRGQRCSSNPSPVPLTRTGHWSGILRWPVCGGAVDCRSSLAAARLSRPLWNRCVRPVFRSPRARPCSSPQA